MPGVPTRRAALPQRPFAFVARGKGLLDGVHNVPMVFMCNMRFGDYLQTDESAYNKMAIAADTARRGLGATKGGKKTSVLTGEYMKVRVEDMRPIYIAEPGMRPAMRVHFTARGALDPRSGAPRIARDRHLWRLVGEPGAASASYAGIAGIAGYVGIC